MVDEDPNIDLPEVDEKPGFPWIGLTLGIVVIILAVGWWFHRQPQHQGKETAIAALDQQLKSDRMVLETEKSRVDEMTKQLNAMKAAIVAHQVKDPKQAVADYNKLAEDQRKQRDTVKTLIDRYNQKVAQIRSLEE